MQAKASLFLGTLCAAVACVAAVLPAAGDTRPGWDRPGVPDRPGPDRPGPDRPAPGRPDHDRPNRRPGVIIEPNIFISRDRRPDVDAPQFIMEEIEGCASRGVRLFVDCLRPNHGSVMIRRLEACVRSEAIPDNPREVEACLPPASVR